MTSSVDGRLLVARWSKPADGVDQATLRGHYDAVAARLGPDGWLVGRVTMSEFADSESDPAISEHPSKRETFIGAREGRPLAIGIDPGGRLHYAADEIAGDHIVAVLSERVSDAYLAELRATGVSYVFAGPDGRDLSVALEAVHFHFGIDTLVLEGGGVTNGTFLKEGLIDEISLLVCPTIDGLSGVPSIFEYVGKPGELPGDGQALRHVSTETLEGGTVWLRYIVEKAS